MFQKLRFVAVFLMLGWGAGGGLIAKTPPQAASIEPLIQAVQKTYNGATDVKSDFTQQTFIPSLERTVEKTGRTLFQKPGKFRVEYAGEQGRLYVSNGKKLWIFESGDSQVRVFPANNETIPEEALSFLGGLGDLKAQFQVKTLSPAEYEKTKANRSLDWLLLIPKNPKSTLDELLLGFDRGTHLVSEAYLKNETGNVSHYLFQNTALNSQIPEEEFVFQKPKGVKEIEENLK